MSISIEYNCDLDLFKGINLQLITEEHKVIISSISEEDSQQVIPNTPFIIIQMALPNIELMCILNLSTHSAEVIGKKVFCHMFSFEDIIAYRYVDEIIFMPCVQNRIRDTDENILLDKFLVFCGTITNLLSPFIETDMQDLELLKFIFNEAFEMI